jgi:hypothetical protein
LRNRQSVSNPEPPKPTRQPIQRSKPHYRISKSGFLTISPAMVEKYFKDCQHAQMLFDQETRRIAVKPAGPNDSNTLKLGLPKGSRSKRASIAGFLEFCGFKPSKNASYEAKWDEELGAVVAELPKA